MSNKAAELGPSMVSWWCDWREQPGAAVIAGGPSAKTAGVEKLQGKVKAIAVNDAYKLAPWADVLYGCDLGWWDIHHKTALEFKGLKLTHDLTGPHRYKGLHRLAVEKPACDDILLEQPSYLGAGGNGGFQALNLAIQFGVKRIMLVGVDCTIDHGPHWFGRHPPPLSNPLESNVRRWRDAFDKSAARIKLLGVEVVNCSQISTLANYSKMSIDEALARWKI